MVIRLAGGIEAECAGNAPQNCHVYRVESLIGGNRQGGLSMDIVEVAGEHQRPSNSQAKPRGESYCTEELRSERSICPDSGGNPSRSIYGAAALAVNCGAKVGVRSNDAQLHGTNFLREANCAGVVLAKLRFFGGGALPAVTDECLCFPRLPVDQEAKRAETGAKRGGHDGLGSF